MKKIFRMALVFALAGATLMYTGCTKDYSEDINKLDKELQTLEDQYKALSDELSTLKSGVASLEAAYKAADTALDTKFSAKIDEIQKAIDNKADKSYVEEQIEALRKEALESANALEKKLDGKLAEAQKLLDEAIAAFSNELRSLVFVPDFYYAGIEATDYTYAYVGPEQFNKEKDDRVIKVPEVDVPAHFEFAWRRIGRIIIPTFNWVEETYKNVDTKFTLLKNEPTSVSPKKDAKGNPIFYSHGQVAEALYNLNPSSFDTNKAEWSLEGDDYVYISKADEKKVWSPEVVGTPANEDGVAIVKYIINNPEVAASPYFARLAEEWDNAFIDALAEYQEDLKDYVPVMKLNAAIKGDKPKNISSDYEAVILSPEFFTELAFVKNSYKTGIECELGGDHLFPDAELAVLAAPSVPVAYNKGAFDLAPYIAIHMQAGKGGYETTLDKLQAAYPELSMTYQLINYTIGDNKTPQSAYGRIEGSKFFPQYVNAEGKSVDCTATSGESAVGKFPVVLVTLYDGEEVVLAGYFKIEIVKEVSTKTITLPEFGPYPYICDNNTAKTTWNQFSALILEELGTNYGEFVNDYEIEKKDGAVVIYTMRDGKLTSDMTIYDKDGEPTGDFLDYGSVTYNNDKDGTGVNDAFVWTITKAAADCIGAGKEQTIYIKFTKGQYNTLYIGFTASIAAPAEITYGEINPVYWFEDIDAGVKSTVRNNVLVPNKTDDNVTNFAKNLTDNFVGNTVKAILKEGSQDVYAKYFDGKAENGEMDIDYEFRFSAEQPVINGVPFMAVNNYELWSAKMKNGQPDLKDGKLQKDAMIAELSGEHYKTLTYKTNDKAKEFLNLWAITETEVEKMLYANVDIITTAGKKATENTPACIAASDTSMFHVRFVRPLTITNGEGGKLVDGEPAGSELALGYLFNAIDWNGLNEKPLFSWHAKTDKENYEGFVANTYKNIVWYTYYGISQVFVDCANTLTNQTGEWKKLSEVNKNPNFIFALYKGTAPDDDNVATEIEDIVESNKIITGLTEFKLHYENNMGETEDFALRIPVEVTYKWGTIKVEVEIPVQGTKNK